MTSKDEARHSSLLETKGFMISTNTIWNLDNPITEENTRFNTFLTRIGVNKTKHIEILTGYTVDKFNKQQILLNDLLVILPNIRTWASRLSVNKPDVKAKASKSESDILKLADTLLLSYAQGIKELIEANPAVIDPDYVTTGRKTLFDQHILDYEGVLEMPKQMIDLRARATKDMIADIKEAVKQRKDTFLDTVKRKREDEPDWVKDFRQSMKIDANPIHKLPFIGKTIEDDPQTRGGRAIANVFIFFPALDKSAKSGEKGNFLFKSLPAGEHTAIFTKFGYEPVTKIIVINDNERSEIEIKMVKKIFE
jgi:hypothetical protein